MKVRVLGTKEVDYTNRNGQRIQGVDIYGAFKDAVEDSAAKLTKSFEKILIEVIILVSIQPL